MTTLSRSPEQFRRPKPSGRTRLRQWLLHDLPEFRGLRHGPYGRSEKKDRPHRWWQVMCLTGVDYFSTLGYQPAIAVLAVGALSPVAALFLVVVTLCGALPVYRRVARESPHGAGSIAMLERLLPHWRGKFLVLALLGFAITDFMITITLSTADATAHLIHNPLLPAGLAGHEVGITLGLLAALGAVFLRGFREAIGLAVLVVGLYLSLSAVLIIICMVRVFTHPQVTGDWWTVVTASHGNPVMALALAVLVFPKLALGLSGFETGVAVMPQVRGGASDTEERPEGRIRGTRRLLTTAAVIMSAFLLTSNFATVLLIPGAEFRPGGSASGRALAYLAHEQIGEGFGTVYDLSTIAILWFAGASAMAGLLNLIPRFLPRYGMAPPWARASRPLILVLVGIAFAVTVAFRADVNAQGGAYATGVLVLITSAAVAVTLSARTRGQRRATLGFGLIAVVFCYTTGANIVEHPDGVRTAGIFIGSLLMISFASRVRRSFDLHATGVRLTATALEFRVALEQGPVHLIAHDPRDRRAASYREKLAAVNLVHQLPEGATVAFLEVVVQDSSEFETELDVQGTTRHGYRVLEVSGPAIPNSIASVLLYLRDITAGVPHMYFGWTEGNPVTNLLRFLVLGAGEIAPVTREVLRRAEPDLRKRPRVHVG